jgi:hypothetical protein
VIADQAEKPGREVNEVGESLLSLVFLQLMPERAIADALLPTNSIFRILTFGPSSMLKVM